MNGCFLLFFLVTSSVIRSSRHTSATTGWATWPKCTWPRPFRPASPSGLQCPWMLPRDWESHASACACWHRTGHWCCWVCCTLCFAPGWAPAPSPSCCCWPWGCFSMEWSVWPSCRSGNGGTDKSWPHYPHKIELRENFPLLTDNASARENFPLLTDDASAWERICPYWLMMLLPDNITCQQVLPLLQLCPVIHHSA